MTSEYQKMIAGEFYRPSDPELRALAEGSRNHQDLVWLDREKSLYQYALDGGLRC